MYRMNLVISLLLLFYSQIHTAHGYVQIYLGQLQSLIMLCRTLNIVAMQSELIKMKQLKT
jgi:cadmium resistance protein CadD (predicted permease)